MSTLRLRVMQLAGRAVAATPARRLLDGDLARRLRLRAGRQVTAARAREIVDRLEAVALPYWVSGGWGVDALLCRQTRPHLDLDLVVDASLPDLRGRIDAALGPLGLRLTATETSIPPLPTVWVYSDGRGTVAEIMPADLAAPPFDAAGAWATGRIEGRPVACISADVQRGMRVGYRHRAADRDDLAALATLPPS